MNASENFCTKIIKKIAVRLLLLNNFNLNIYLSCIVYFINQLISCKNTNCLWDIIEIFYAFERHINTIMVLWSLSTMPYQEFSILISHQVLCELVTYSITFMTSKNSTRYLRLCGICEWLWYVPYSRTSVTSKNPSRSLTFSNRSIIGQQKLAIIE